MRWTCVVRVVRTGLVLIAAAAGLFMGPLQSASNLDMEKAWAREMLKTICRSLEQNFYDPGLNGRDLERMRKETEDLIQITVARLLFPDGETLERRGVIPDRTCIATAEDLVQEREPCLELALGMAREALGLEGATLSSDMPRHLDAEEAAH